MQISKTPIKLIKVAVDLIRKRNLIVPTPYRGLLEKQLEKESRSNNIHMEAVNQN